MQRYSQQEDAQLLDLINNHRCNYHETGLIMGRGKSSIGNRVTVLRAAGFHVEPVYGSGKYIGIDPYADESDSTNCADVTILDTEGTSDNSLEIVSVCCLFVVLALIGFSVYTT